MAFIDTDLNILIALEIRLNKKLKGIKDSKYLDNDTNKLVKQALEVNSKLREKLVDLTNEKLQSNPNASNPIPGAKICQWCEKNYTGRKQSKYCSNSCRASDSYHKRKQSK